MGSTVWQGLLQSRALKWSCGRAIDPTDTKQLLSQENSNNFVRDHGRCCREISARGKFVLVELNLQCNG